MCICTVNGKRLELSTPNFVHLYSVAVTWHALTWKSKGQGHMVSGYENDHIFTLLVNCGCILLPCVADASMGLHEFLVHQVPVSCIILAYILYVINTG